MHFFRVTLMVMILMVAHFVASGAVFLATIAVVEMLVSVFMMAMLVAHCLLPFTVASFFINDDIFFLFHKILIDLAFKKAHNMYVIEHIVRQYFMCERPVGQHTFSLKCMLSNKIENLYGVTMDRRKRKTRDAIFSAFISLLSKRDYNAITVGDIIEKADVGRATFYDHFETKDFLLKELCKELFNHIFEVSLGEKTAHQHIFDCDDDDSALLHLIKHLGNNDNHVTELLVSQNNALFIGYFQDELRSLMANQDDLMNRDRFKNLPKDYVINHVTSAFVATINWWIDGGMKPAPETVYGYFLTAIQ